MKGIHLTLREDQLKALKAVSKETMAPVNALIRKAIDEFLKKRK